MKKIMICLAAVITMAASAYFIAEHSGARAVTAQADCGGNSQCE